MGKGQNGAGPRGNENGGNLIRNIYIYTYIL